MLTEPERDVVHVDDLLKLITPSSSRFLGHSQYKDQIVVVPRLSGFDLGLAYHSLEKSKLPGCIVAKGIGEGHATGSSLQLEMINHITSAALSRDKGIRQ